jgi:L-asparaginase/Glu-tRNA(Gln) amidotransferase subunit D
VPAVDLHVLGGDLGGPTARIKLMVALGWTSNTETLRGIFEA